MRRVHEIIIRPLTTEKTAILGEEDGIFAFEVGRDATKIEIKEAVQGLFGVKVDSVRTVVVRGKWKRFGRHFGKRSNWKKAYIKLVEGESLNVYAGL